MDCTASSDDGVEFSTEEDWGLTENHIWITGMSATELTKNID